MRAKAIKELVHYCLLLISSPEVVNIIPVQQVGTETVWVRSVAVREDVGVVFQ